MARNPIMSASSQMYTFNIRKSIANQILAKTSKAFAFFFHIRFSDFTGSTKSYDGSNILCATTHTVLLMPAIDQRFYPCTFSDV